MKTVFLGRQWSETPDADGKLTKRVIGVQMNITDEHGNPIGHANVSQHAVDVRVNHPFADVQKLADAIETVLVGEGK